MIIDKWRALLSIMFLLLFTSLMIIEYRGILGPNDVNFFAWLWFGFVMTIILIFIIYFFWKYDHHESNAACCKYYRENKNNSIHSICEI